MGTWMFWLLVVGLFAYEAWALLNTTSGDTISEVFWRLSRNPLVPFLMGFLMGHFFWQKGP